jgi:apolipoprotein D and lipocalin family protein
MRTPRTRRLTLGLGLGLSFAAAIVTAAWASLPPQPAKALDTSRFIGRWYEVARMPNKIQSDCVASLADWTHGDGDHFNVIQTCHTETPSGPTKVWKATGHIVDPVTNAKFRMSFFGGLISQEYWVLDRGDDYSWLILSTPNPKFMWIFARHSAIAPAQKAALVSRVRAMGYDVATLVYDQPGA